MGDNCGEHFCAVHQNHEPCFNANTNQIDLKAEKVKTKEYRKQRRAEERALAEERLRRQPNGGQPLAQQVRSLKQSGFTQAPAPAKVAMPAQVSNAEARRLTRRKREQEESRSTQNRVQFEASLRGSMAAAPVIRSDDGAALKLCDLSVLENARKCFREKIKRVDEPQATKTPAKVEEEVTEDGVVLKTIYTENGVNPEWLQKGYTVYVKHERTNDKWMLAVVKKLIKIGPKWKLFATLNGQRRAIQISRKVKATQWDPSQVKNYVRKFTGLRVAAAEYKPGYCWTG